MTWYIEKSVSVHIFVFVFVFDCHHTNPHTFSFSFAKCIAVISADLTTCLKNNSHFVISLKGWSLALIVNVDFKMQ